VDQSTVRNIIDDIGQGSHQSLHWRPEWIHGSSWPISDNETQPRHVCPAASSCRQCPRHSQV